MMKLMNYAMKQHHLFLTYKDTIVVASVSCIYGIGEVEEYQNKMLTLSIGDEIEREIKF